MENKNILQETVTISGRRGGSLVLGKKDGEDVIKIQLISIKKASGSEPDEAKVAISMRNETLQKFPINTEKAFDAIKLKSGNDSPVAATAGSEK